MVESEVLSFNGCVFFGQVFHPHFGVSTLALIEKDLAASPKKDVAKYAPPH